MAGLLDNFGKWTGDPDKDSAIGQGLLEAAFRMMSTRGSFGDAVGQGGLAGMGAYNSTLAESGNNNLRKLQGERMQADVADRDERKRAAQAQAAQQEAFFRSLQPTAGIDANRVSGMTGPTPAAAGMIGQQREPNPLEAFRALGPEGGKAFFESRNWGRPEVARTVDTANGIQQMSKYGDGIGAPLPFNVKPELVDLHNRKLWTIPKAGQSFDVGMSPSDQLTMRGQNMTDARSRERLELDRQGGGVAPLKPLPASALKMQQSGLDAIGVVGSVNADLSALEKQIDGGKLKFGPVSNLSNAGLNMAGMSTEGSRNFSSFKATLERLRNESLRLNTGVQTDGDAQRAWSELFQSINDTDLVKQRLGEIKAINKRGAELQQMKVDSVRSNYGHPPLDSGAYANQPPALNSGAATSVQTATNPKTGEKVQLINGQWVPVK